MKIKVLNTETQVEVREMNLDDWIDQTGECSLGRSPYSGLVLDSPDVSRLHAKLAFESGHYYFYDLGSSNGSMINGRVVDPQQKQLLKPGDIIRVGEFMLTLHSLNDQAESLPATVIGGSEMTVCGQFSPSEPLSIHSVPVAEVSISQLEQQLELSALEAASQEESSVLEKPPEAATLTDILADHKLSDDEIENQTDGESENTTDNFSSDEQATELSTDAVTEAESIELPESNFTVIQLEPSVDLSEASIVDTTGEAVEPLSREPFEERDDALGSNVTTDKLSTDSLSTEEPTFIQSGEPSEPEAVTSEPMHQLNADLEQTSDDTSKSQQFSNLVEATLEPLEADEHLVSPLQLPGDLDQPDESDITEGDAPDLEIEPRLEVDRIQNSDSTLPTETMDAEICDKEEIVNPDLWNEPSNIEELKLETLDEGDSTSSNYANEQVDESDLITPDTRIPAPAEHPPVLSEKYVALLAHDNQATALAELVETHKAFLAHCSTIATPSISEVLKQHTGFEVTQQTPSIPVGGYQTINGLITADKIAAVIFLRDFLNAQVNSVNDEAFSRSCNIHQVLFASNFSTADALLDHLQVASQQAGASQ
ncbi:MAG: methylglyoxal synthase [Cyanobacteria bacterium RM1_2_2]|nr:methylglyoxal synthase [Cyanobacteria bacterium RM1_2_2]